MDEPPDDAEAWSHEQWIEWLNATRPTIDEETPTRRGPLYRGTAARMVGAGMLGLEQAIFGPSEGPDIVMIADANGDDDPDAMKLDLVPDDPKATIAVLPETEQLHGGSGPDKRVLQ